MALLRKLWEKYRAQPLWVRIGFILALLLLLQILTHWQDFLKGLSEGFRNYGFGAGS